MAEPDRTIQGTEAKTLLKLTIPQEAFEADGQDVLIRYKADGRPFGYADGPGVIESSRELEWVHVPRRPQAAAPDPRMREVVQARAVLAGRQGVDEAFDELALAVRDTMDAVWQRLSEGTRQTMERRFAAMDALKVEGRKRQPEVTGG